MNRFCKNHAFLMLVFVLIFIVITSNISELAYADQRSSEYRLNKRFLKNFKNDFISICTSPTKWKKKDFLILSAVLGTGAVLYVFDEDIYDWTQKNKSPFSKKASSIISNFGNGLFLGGLITTLYTVGELKDDHLLRKTSLLSLESWLTSGAIVLSLKFLLGRARPFTGARSTEFKPFSSGSSFYSLPSGHAASAFAVAAVITTQSDSKFVDILVYSLASMVAISRLHDQKHWPSDIFIGSALGYFVGKTICHLNNSRGKNGLNLGFQLSPYHQGITISYRF